MNNMIRLCTRFWVVALALPIVGCGVSPQTQDSLARSETVVTQTQQALGTAESAASELQNARNSIDQAKQAARDGDEEMAVRLAHAASLQAELATAKNQSATARKVADDTRAGIETLRKEAERPLQ
jgi:hypothetical protein